MIDKLIGDKKIGLKFLIVGGIGFIANYTVLKIGIAGFGLNRVVAEAIATVAALQVTFILHDKWTYHKPTAKGYHKTLRHRYAIYLTSNSFGSIMTIALFAIFSTFLGHLPALASAAAISMVWNFIINKIFVWKHKATVDEVF